MSIFIEQFPLFLNPEEIEGDFQRTIRVIRNYILDKEEERTGEEFVVKKSKYLTQLSGILLGLLLHSLTPVSYFQGKIKYSILHNHINYIEHEEFLPVGYGLLKSNVGENFDLQDYFPVSGATQQKKANYEKLNRLGLLDIEIRRVRFVPKGGSKIFVRIDLEKIMKELTQVADFRTMHLSETITNVLDLINEDHHVEEAVKLIVNRIPVEEGQ